MDNALWLLFRDTGDPMCYLLYRAGMGTKCEEEMPEPEKLKASPQPAAEG